MAQHYQSRGYQNDIFTKLAECSTLIKEHAETLLTHQLAIVACETTEVTALGSVATELKPTDSTSTLNYPEILESLSKAHNLIISNLPELPDDASDKTTVARLIDHISPNSSPHISCCVRLPARNTARPRWLKVTLYNPDNVLQLLRNKGSLCGHPISETFNYRMTRQKTKERT
ncbi:hypothetical protein HHI36_010335 [Cryptolaemus montrouzieri]|uniref:Uncharacterized protein n=1 Tax=Cryptolaemus montrouzieri TaxID=559131 RepID=A0ABD2MIE6_9CUCU